jgi:hypothetical protein
VRVAAVLALLVAVTGCAKQDTAPPVATVTFSATANKTRLTPGSPVEFTYQFDVAPGAQLEADYLVFTQVVDSHGHNTSWNDDHFPPVRTSQWKPGQTIKYTRTSFVPVVPNIGEVLVEVGLYKDQQRLPLTTVPPPEKAPRTRAFRVGKLQLAPASENTDPRIVRGSGWHQADYEGVAWTWTDKSAMFGLEFNPHKDVTLYVQYDAEPQWFGDAPQHVTVSLGNEVLAQFAADTKDRTVRKIPITAAQFGSGDTPPQFRLEVDRTFVPAKLPDGTSKDTREFGLRVFHCYIEAR